MPEGSSLRDSMHEDRAVAGTSSTHHGHGRRCYRASTTARDSAVSCMLSRREDPSACRPNGSPGETRIPGAIGAHVRPRSGTDRIAFPRAVGPAGGRAQRCGVVRSPMRHLLKLDVITLQLIFVSRVDPRSSADRRARKSALRRNVPTSPLKTSVGKAACACLPVSALRQRTVHDCEQGRACHHPARRSSCLPKKPVQPFSPARKTFRLMYSEWLNNLKSGRRDACCVNEVKTTLSNAPLQ